MGRPKKKYSATSSYKRRLRQRYKKLFPCSFCKEMILAENYENHIKNQKHALDVKRKCPWCQKLSWNSGKKHQNMDHLYNCVELFFNRQNTIFREEEEEESPQYTPVYDLTPEFKTKDFFGEERLNIPHSYDRVGDDSDYNVPDKYMLEFDSSTKSILKEFNSITFQCDILNRAADIVKYYLLTTRLSDDNNYGLEKKNWYHVMIKTVAINSFYENIDQYDSMRTKILPHYCHCTGAGKNATKFNQHIHLLLVTKADNHFESTVWKRLKPYDSPIRNYKCKYMKSIVSPFHLLNTIGYLSGRRSICELERFLTEETRLNHFNINCSLPKDFKYALATLWETGMQELVDSVHQHYKPLFNIHYKTDDRGVVHVDGQWKIKYQYLPGLMEKIMEIPINLHYRRVEYKTNTYLHLGKKYTLYLEYDDQSRFSAKILREGLIRDYFNFRPKIQETFNIVKRTVDQVLDMKNTLHMEMKEMNQNQQKTIENQQKTIENQQKTIENLQNAIANLQNVIQAKDAQLEYLHKNRYRDLQKTIENLQAEVRELKTTLQAKELEMEKMKRNPVYYVSITP